MLYLTPEARGAAVARLRGSLAPGGWLFLGHADSLRGSEGFAAEEVCGTFLYRRTAAEGASPVAGWVGSIHASADRIASLEPPPVPAGDLSRALDLLAAERFTEALAQLDGLSQTLQRDPGTRLLRAVLMLHAGRIAEAEAAGHDLLDTGGERAPLHHLIALCREAAGDRAGARAHGRRAVDDDPGFALSHLHLGVLARRDGDVTEARERLERALELLPGEDTSRIQLFGGGFPRHALVELCRTELRACSGGR